MFCVRDGDDSSIGSSVNFVCVCVSDSECNAMLLKSCPKRAILASELFFTLQDLDFDKRCTANFFACGHWLKCVRVGSVVLPNCRACRGFCVAFRTLYIPLQVPNKIVAPITGVKTKSGA